LGRVEPVRQIDLAVVVLHDALDLSAQHAGLPDRATGQHQQQPEHQPQAEDQPVFYPNTRGHIR
jgi:hypothetical protein